MRHNTIQSEVQRLARRAGHLRTLMLECTRRKMFGEATKLAADAARAEERALELLGYIDCPHLRVAR